MVGFTLIVANFEVVTGETGLTNWLLIPPTPVRFVTGILVGLRITSRSPKRYAALASHTDEEIVAR